VPAPVRVLVGGVVEGGTATAGRLSADIPALLCPARLLAIQPGRPLLRAALAAVPALLLAGPGRAPRLALAAGARADRHPPGRRPGFLADDGPAHGPAPRPGLGGPRPAERADAGRARRGAGEPRPGSGPLTAGVPAGPAGARAAGVGPGRGRRRLGGDAG